MVETGRKSAADDLVHGDQWWSLSTKLVAGLRKQGSVGDIGERQNAVGRDRPFVFVF